jgi:hypothetical protein
VDDAFPSEEIIFQSDVVFTEISGYFAINFAFNTLMNGKSCTKRASGLEE